MSRNLCQIECVHCGDCVVHIESPRPITRDECGVYFDEYRGMLVANAYCQTCEAKYLAWCTKPKSWEFVQKPAEPGCHYDLSYRSTFNDEPGRDDLPKWEVKIETVRTKIGPFPVPSYLK